MTRKTKYATCKSCGWVHFQVSFDYIYKWQADWVEHWYTLDEQGREAYGVKAGPPKRSQYFVCFRCGGTYKNFRDSAPNDMVEGSTIQPILNRNE